MSWDDFIARILNGSRKIAAGLRPFNESIWPGVRNDLFVAHESIYEFFCRYASGRRILDAGCGTGYGDSRLAAAGASVVVGVDIDRSNIRYASRRYPASNVIFRQGDIENLQVLGDTFDLVVASNSLEHLTDPKAFLSGVSRVLRPKGTIVVAVPPILSDRDAAVHERIHYHRSNLTVRGWHELFVSSGFAVHCFSHRPANETIQPDFSSRRSSRLTVSDFVFIPTDLAGLHSAPSITAVFELQRAG